MVKRGLALLLIFVILAILVSFSGCVFQKTQTNPYLRKVNDLELIATPIQKTIVYTSSEALGGQFNFFPTIGNYFIIANLTIINAGTNSASLDIGSFYIIDLDAKAYPARVKGDSSSLLQIIELPPGKNVTGRIYFELPWDSIPDRLAISRTNDTAPGESPFSWALEDHEKQFTERDARFMGKKETEWKVN